MRIWISDAQYADLINRGITLTNTVKPLDKIHTLVLASNSQQNIKDNQKSNKQQGKTPDSLKGEHLEA